MAVNTLIPGFGQAFVAIALFFFAFTTLLAYYYYAETNVAYLFKGSKNHKTYFLITKIALLGMTFFGAVRTADLAWAMGDIGVGAMAWLNIIAIILLTKVGVGTLKDYEKQKKEGKDPIYEPETLGVKNADVWKAIAARYKKKVS